MENKASTSSCKFSDVKYIDDDEENTCTQTFDSDIANEINIEEIILKIKCDEAFEDGIVQDDGEKISEQLHTLKVGEFAGDNEAEKEEDNGAYDDEDAYECTLNEQVQKKAEEELKETADERKKQIESLRQWCRNEAGLKSPCDSRYLLTFLRARKFKQTEARSLLKRHLIMKTRMKECFDNLDPCQAGIQAVLKEGFVYPLPRRSAENCLYVIFNYGKLEPWKGAYSKTDVMRSIACVIYFLFFIEELNQINGVCIINDLSCMTFRHKTLFSIDEQKLFYGRWNKSIPARIKKICLYHAGSSLGDLVCKTLKMITAEKLLQRIVNCGSVESLRSQVPAEVLPVEYLSAQHTGPHGGTIVENIDRLIEDIREPSVRQRIQHISSSRYKIDLCKYSPSLSQSLRKLIP